MKKVLLSSAIVLASAMTVMAQTTPTKEEKKDVQEEQTEQTEDATEDLEYEQLSNEPEEGYMDEDNALGAEGVEEVELESLPVAVQDAFSGSEYKDWKIVRVNRLAGNEITPDESYEIAVVSEDVKDEIEDAGEDIEDQKEEAVEEGMEVTEETVSVEVPALILHYDKNGQLLSAKEQAGDELED
jgi:hypothetical protein